MPLLLTRLCDLLSALEDLSTRDPPYLPARYNQRLNEVITSWFKSHNVSINSPDIDVVALLSALFPGKRTDRVYNIQPPRLTKLLRRCLRLGRSRWPQLDQWKEPGKGDLGACVERVLQGAELPIPHTRNRVTLEQVDGALATVAARCRFSAPSVRSRELEKDGEISTAFENIYQRLQSREAKWFTRMILKDYPCLGLTESMIYFQIDLRFRVAMQMYDSFEAAVTELKALPASQVAEPTQGAWTQQCAHDAHLLPPRIGTKLGPPKWIKAKGGTKHAVTIIDGRTMSMERKHDGEYCQIHIDLSKGDNAIQIISKSGKDSTMDRIGVHQAINDGLRIGRDDCGFSQRCMLEGELLVSSEREDDVLGFHTIRKHVSRSGSFLGTTLDSQPHPWEHLMIIFYDVMLIDDDPVLHQPHRQRRRLLEGLVSQIEGRTGLVWHREIDFSKPRGPHDLKKALAFAFVQRWEGLVLKPADEPYFDLTRPAIGRYPSRWIKLKKDCIKGLGDTADFAVIGAGYNVKEATKSPSLNLSWTHFYIGCLRNKEQVLGSGAMPIFFVFDKVSDCIKREDLLYLNRHGKFPDRALEPGSADALETFDLEFASGLAKPRALFRKPFVFEIAGSGFDKSPNRDIFTLRFPRVMKIHQDRDWRQAVSLDELQEMVTEARTVPSRDLVSGEVKAWMAKLDNLDHEKAGQRPPWDYSGNEGDDAIDECDSALASSRSNTVRKSGTPAAPFLKQIHTAKMRPVEQRVDSGKVIERPSSKHSMSSIASNGTLQTPPLSSPLSKGSGSHDVPLDRLDTNGPLFTSSKKRSATGSFRQEDIRSSKRARPQSVLHSKSMPNPSSTSIIGQKRPLREIINPSASPVRRSDSFHNPPNHHAEPLTTNSLFVQKVIAASDEHLRRMYKRRRIIKEPWSPARETTVSPSTIASTTQQTVNHEAVYVPSPSPLKRMTKTAHMSTPPSTAESKFFKKHIKKLRECCLILSPCITNTNHPLKQLLAKYLIPHLPFPPSELPSNPVWDMNARKSGVYVLIDIENEENAGRCVWCLVKQVSQWHLKPISLWDWRLVEAILKDEVGDEAEKKRLVGKYFYAQLSSNSEVAVEVRWRDGTISRVPEEELDQHQIIEEGVDGRIEDLRKAGDDELSYEGVLALWA